MLWGLFGETTSVVSKGEREATEVIAKARLHASVLHKLGSRWAKPGPYGRAELTMESGGRGLALPATSGGRSFSGNMLLDEFAYHKDAEAVWDGASGTVLHGYKLRVLSTPNGVGNLFHGLWSDPKQNAGYTLHQTTLEEAVADGLVVNMPECWTMARNDPRVFDQLFHCSFLDNDAQYIPSAFIAACSVPDVYAPEGECYAGLDVGKTSDRTVLCVVREGPDGVAWLIHTEELKRTSSADIDALVSKAIHDFRCRRICIDATGMGAFPAEDMQRKYGRSRVEPVGFTMQVKEDLATGMYQRFADYAIRIPQANEDLRNDIATIRRIITTAGNVRYDSPQNTHGHGDRAWALALALHGCAKPSSRRTEILPHEPPYEEYDD